MSSKKTNKVKFELETEGGEIAQVPNNKKKPFKIERGGIARPLGNGFYYLQGKSHENGGIDMTFNTDARIFSSVPFLNGKSPAERVMGGENPDTTFAWQEEFKDVNRINDDGSRKAKYGKLQKKSIKSTEENPITVTDFNKGLYKYGEEDIKKLDPSSLTRNDINDTISIIDKDDYFYTIASDINGNPVGIFGLNDSNELPLGYSKNKNNEIKQSLINARKQLDYIGTGDNEKARFFGKTKSIVNAVDSLSNVYGINKDIFFERLSHEGIIDDLINSYNYRSNKEQQENISNYSLNNKTSAFDQLGLDRAGEHLAKGHYNIRWKDKNLGYWDEHHTNEDGVVVHSVGVPNLASGLEIKAAHIEYLTNLMKKKYPNATKKELDALINAAYNLGENHEDLNEREWINKNYEVLPWSEMINKSMNNSNKKRLGGSTGLIRVQANGKDRLMYVPFTGEETKASREKAKYGTRRATDGNRFMSYDRASYLLNLNKGNNINIIDDKVKEKINDIPSEKDIKPIERDIKPIERDIVEKENLEFTNGNKTEAAPKPVGKSYHNISASNSSAVARGIARKLNYNFSDHGSTDFRTADLNNAIFTNRPDTVPTITSIYGNDFVAPSGTLGSTRRAIDFKNENRNQNIDNKIPVNKISRYYGNNKQGDFIIGDLSNFEDDDYIAAVRNKSMPFNDVRIENGKLYYLKDGEIIDSSLPEGENNKHIVYNSKTGKKQFVSTTRDINKLYDFYKQFLTDNEGLADIVLLDNGRFEDNIYKGGRPLTDEEISDYYRNDFNRGFDKVPVLISGKMKKFGGKVSNRTKANLGLQISSNFTPTLSYLRTHPYSSSRDVVADVMTGKTRTLDFADPYRPNKTYRELLDEGYFDETGFTTYGRRMNYNINSNNIEETTQSTDNVIKQNSSANNTVGVKANVTIPRFNASEEYKKHLNGHATPDTISLNPNLQDSINRMNKIEGSIEHAGLHDYTVPEVTNKQVRQQTRAALKKEGLDWVSRNKDWAAPAISALGNIGASLISYGINKRMLGDLDYSPTPVAKRAAKLKTNISINPELTALSENLSRTIESTNANTASSRVANARNQASMLNTTLTTNKLYANKENRETALINQDRLNQQEVANANIDAYNNWRTGKTNFENTIREQQSENAVSLVDNINKGIQTGITDAERRRQFKNNLAIMAAAYPNVTPTLLRSYGADFLRMGGKVKLNKKK